MIRIRLSRQGKKKKPFYRIVVTDKRNRRDGEPVEQLGTYDPTNKSINLDKEKTDSWIKKGACPTPTVTSLIKKHSA